MSLCVLMYRRSSESRMRSRTLRGVSKWSRRKDRYIGRLYSDIGKVSSDSGIFGVPGSYWNSPGEVLGLIGPYGNRGERPKGRRRAAPLWSELDKGCGPLFLPPLLLFPPFPTPTRKGGVLLPVGLGLLMGRTKGGRPLPLLHSFIYGEGGTP